MSINPNAPVISSGEIEIAAPVARVWDIISAVEQWPLWNPEIKWAEMRGQMISGTRIFWKAGPGTIISVIQKVEYQRYLSWKGNSAGITAYHVWSLEPIDGGTRVRTEESWEGLLPWLFRGASKKRLDEAIQSGLKYLKAAAERR